MNLFSNPLLAWAWFFSPATMECLGWVLLHSLWQFFLVVILSHAGLRSVKQSSSRLRYGLLVFALAVCAVVPVATWFFVSADPMHVAMEARTDERAAGPIDPMRSHLGTNDQVTIVGDDHGRTEKQASIDNRPSDESSHALTVSGNWWTGARESLRPWLLPMVTAWILGVIICALRPLLSWVAIRRWRRVGTATVGHEVTELMLRLSERFSVNRTVEILQSTLVHVPLVFGYLRPVILLPAGLLTNLPASQLEAIIAHELAHVRRHDFLVNIMQIVIETLFFYHPAIWWLSRRIRAERENCCDDLVVSVLHNRVEYGRALLAVEESPGFSSTLALGARDGSLLARVQRLAGLEATRRRPLAGAAAMVTAGLLFAATVLMIGNVLLAAGDDDEKLFGKESNGIQIRLIPLSTDVSDETPELKNVASAFKRSQDMAFAVQLKNVSDRPIAVAGIRYGDSYAPETRGKLNTAMLAPHWFEFEFTDRSGKRILRTPHREFYQQWSTADNASVHKLAPGESLIEVLRPAKFLQPMDYELLPGKYRVQVNYRGPDDSLRENVRKHWPDKPILNAWPHQATSNVTDFSIEEPSNRTKSEDLIWGTPVDGLQAALEVRLPDDAKGNPLAAPGVAVGTSLGITFHLRNVSDKPITFVSETGRQGDYVHVTDEAGKEVEVKNVFFTGLPIDVAWKVMPGEVAQLNLLTPGLGSLDKPGKYKVRYTIRFNSRQQKDESGKIIFPRPGDYDKEVDTGETPLFLHDNMDVSANGEVQPDSAISANSTKHSAVGVLPNGDTVELIHLATAARLGITGKRVWWKPDGTLDEETNATEAEPEMIHRIMNDRRLFAIHMSSPNAQPSIRLKTIPLMRLEDSAYVDFINENGKPARSLSGQFGPVGNEKQITLKVGVTSEPWGEWQDVGLAGEPLSPFDDKQNYADFYRMIKVVSAGQFLSTILPPPEKVPLLGEKAVSNEKPDSNWVSTVATIQWPENHDDLFAFEFRAVGTDGATNYANISTGTDSSGKTQLFFNGDVLREKLTKYQYRLRPYRHWVTFEDVANQAGVQTNVRVNVEAVVSPKVSSSTITKEDNEKTSLEASTPPVTAEASTVRLEVKGKDVNGKPVVLMSFEELQRDETTSTVRTTYSGGGSVGSSLFITRGACEIAKARGAAYFAKLKEWEGEDGTWRYLFGFSKNKGIRPLTSENELKIFAVSEYEFLFKDTTDANIDIVPDDQYVKSGVPLDELAGEGVTWSDVQNGLSLGYRITGDEWRILGKEVKVELWVQNHSDKDVQLNMHPDLGLRVKLTDPKGEVHDSKIWPNDGPPLAKNCLLPPGHALKVKEFTVSLLWPFNDVSRVQGHFFAINPGAYNFHCELELPGFSAAGEGGKQLTPAAGEWTGKLMTRGLNVEVIAPDAPIRKESLQPPGDGAVPAANKQSQKFSATPNADIEKTVLDILRKPFVDDPGKGTWQLGAHDTDVHWKLRDVPQRTEVIITLFKVIDRNVPSTLHERRLAMEFLAGADPANLVPRLNKELENAIADPAKPFAAYHEIVVLGRMGEHARSSLPLLVKLLDSKDRVAYDAAVNALIIIGARSPYVMNDLAKHTDDPVTVYQLGRYGRTAKPLGPLFVKLLDSPSNEIHSYAASALVRTGFDEARGLGVLMADVAAGKSEDRCRAATSLGSLGSQAVSMIPRLRAFENDPDPQVAKSVRDAIVRIEKNDRILTHFEEATKREAALEASAALNPQREFKLRILGGDEQTPLAGIEIVATDGYGDSQKKFGPFVTDATGTTQCKLPQGFYTLHLNSKKELPWLHYENYWKDFPPPGMKWLNLRVTGIGVEKWLGGAIHESGVEPAKSAEELARVTYTLLKPIELVLRAVDIDTGKGIPGAYFYLESAVAEDWAHPIDGENIGASQYRDGVHKFDSNDYKTDAEGYFKRFVSDGYLRRPGDSEYGPKYGVWKAPDGYEAVGPGEVAIDFPSNNRSSVEHVFKFRKKNP